MGNIEGFVRFIRKGDGINTFFYRQKSLNLPMAFVDLHR